MRAIVTVKFPRNPKHDPFNKVTGKCPLDKEGVRLCTDVTGSHHSYIEEGKDKDNIWLKAREKYAHVTRVEVIEEIETL